MEVCEGQSERSASSDHRQKSPWGIRLLQFRPLGRLHQRQISAYIAYPKELYTFEVHLYEIWYTCSIAKKYGSFHSRTPATPISTRSGTPAASQRSASLSICEHLQLRSSRNRVRLQHRKEVRPYSSAAIYEFHLYEIWYPLSGDARHPCRPLVRDLVRLWPVGSTNGTWGAHQFGVLSDLDWRVPHGSIAFVPTATLCGRSLFHQGEVEATATMDHRQEAMQSEPSVVP